MIIPGLKELLQCSSIIVDNNHDVVVHSVYRVPGRAPMCHQLVEMLSHSLNMSSFALLFHHKS